MDNAYVYVVYASQATGSLFEDPYVRLVRAFSKSNTACMFAECAGKWVEDAARAYAIGDHDVEIRSPYDPVCLCCDTDTMYSVVEIPYGDLAREGVVSSAGASSPT